jgi:hypothetical protein
VNRLGDGFANNVGRMSIGQGEVHEFELEDVSPPAQSKDLKEIARNVVINEFQQQDEDEDDGVEALDEE